MDPEVGKESGDSKEVAETPSGVVETPTEVGEAMDISHTGQPRLIPHILDQLQDLLMLKRYLAF